jgi:hypothetical protein
LSVNFRDLEIWIRITLHLITLHSQYQFIIATLHHPDDCMTRSYILRLKAIKDSALLKQEIDSVCWTCMSGRCMLEFYKISCWMGRCNCHFNTNLKISFTTCCRTYTSNIPCLFLALRKDQYFSSLAIRRTIIIQPVIW